MKRMAMSLAIALVLLSAQGVGATEDTETLTGEYVWSSGGNSGGLEAVFTPTGEGTWDVAFHFSFRRQAHVYTGTALGSLNDGELKGKVLNENKRRTFTFRGTVEDGEFRGSHAEIANGRERKTGSLTLKK